MRQPNLLELAKQQNPCSNTQGCQSQDITNLSRRKFLGLLALSTLSLIGKDLIGPKACSADEVDNNTILPEEKYHIFIGSQIAKNGGIQKVTLKSGKICEVNIPPNCIEGSNIYLPHQGIQNNDVVLTVHTLFDDSVEIDSQILSNIQSSKLKQNSQNRCQFIYEQIKNVELIQDLAALELLDYLISSSQLNEEQNLDIQWHQQYQIASQNAKVINIEKCIETALAASSLAENEQEKLRGGFQYIRATEPVPDFKVLTQLDTIIENSTLPTALKQFYSLASSRSRAYTVDIIIVDLINNNLGLNIDKKLQYLSTYKQIRNGEEVSDQETLASLDEFIKISDIPDNCKVVYKLARDRFFDKKDQRSIEQDFSDVRKIAGAVNSSGSAIISTTSTVLSALGTEAGTGVAISTLSGGAVTNATLAALGGGSVAAGGLGMLGGLAVVTGGAALIGAAGLVSLALVSNMGAKDLGKLGISAVAGTLVSASAVMAAWAAASALGVAGTLTGAAAITTTMAALGGISTITGGAALVTFGAGFVVWKLLDKNSKKQNYHIDQKILQQLEARLYTLLEKSNNPLVELVEKRLISVIDKTKLFVAPDIPLNTLVTALSSYTWVNSDEKVLAIINISLWNDNKQGITFTDKRVIWKNTWSAPESVEYTDPEYLYKLRSLPSLLDEKADQALYALALEVGLPSVMEKLQTIQSAQVL